MSTDYIRHHETIKFVYNVSVWLLHHMFVAIDYLALFRFQYADGGNLVKSQNKLDKWE